MEGFYAAIDFEKEIKEFTQANVFDELLKDLNDEYEHITSEERFLDERERLLGQQEEARHVCH
jgi:hypothetical protein